MRSKMGVGECLCVCMCARGVKITLSLLEETVLCGIAQCTDPPPPQDFLLHLYTSSSFFDIFVHLTVQQSLSPSCFSFFYLYIPSVHLLFSSSLYIVLFYTSLISVRRLCPNRVGLYPCLPACLHLPSLTAQFWRHGSICSTDSGTGSLHYPFKYLDRYVVFRDAMFGGDFLVHTLKEVSLHHPPDKRGNG